MPASNLEKIQSQADYSGAGKLVDLQFAVVDLSEAITYATDGIELDWTDINADLVADDVLFAHMVPKGPPSESVDTYVCRYNYATAKMQIFQSVDVATTPTASLLSEVSNAATINTDFRLLVGFVRPGTNA